MSQTRRVAVTQSNYIPWKGYFDIIQSCEHVVFLDDVQYTRRDWRNRNQIKTPQGLKWLTIPVDVRGQYSNQRICEVNTSENGWAQSHWSQIEQSYRKAPFFKEQKPFLQGLFEQAAQINNLSKINFLFIKSICERLEIPTQFSWSTDHYSLAELDTFSSTERLLGLARKVNANEYISGPAAKEYMELDIFEQASMEVKWADYSDYKIYEQLHGEFTHGVSIIDLLMMTGPMARNFLKGPQIAIS